MVSRRIFLGTLGAAALAPGADADSIIDIHQHTNYSGRTDEQLLFHQSRMGVTQTILLPAGSVVNRPSTHDGKTNGLAAQCGGNETVAKIVREHPGEYFNFAIRICQRNFLRFAQWEEPSITSLRA